MSNADKGILCLEGDCGLRKSVELVSQIKQQLAIADDIAIDAAAATAADISTVQILVSAHKSALAAGKTLRVHAPPGGALEQVLVKGGFMTAAGVAIAPDDAPWVLEPPPSSGDAA